LPPPHPITTPGFGTCRQMLSVLVSSVCYMWFYDFCNSQIIPCSKGYQNRDSNTKTGPSTLVYKSNRHHSSALLSSSIHYLGFGGKRPLSTFTSHHQLPILFLSLPPPPSFQARLQRSTIPIRAQFQWHDRYTIMTPHTPPTTRHSMTLALTTAMPRTKQMQQMILILKWMPLLKMTWRGFLTTTSIPHSTTFG
jgi:hypothetical protein